MTVAIRYPASAPKTSPDAGMGLLTLRQAANLVGVCAKTLHAWEARGLRVVRVGSYVRIARQDLEAFLESQKAATR